MENMNDMEQRSLVNELTQGMELANQLKNQINPMTSKETCEHLVQRILSIYDKALACVNLAEPLQKSSLPIVGLIGSRGGISPKIGCARDHSPRDFKKRRTFPRYSKQIKVPSGKGLEGALEDGHSWRKYGQKDILGATHPRAYYRCTHKYSRGCGATKQLQKTEKDPLIFEVTYRGEHTCMDVPNSPSSVVSQEVKSEDIINNFEKQPEPEQMQKQNIPFQFGQCLEVETEEINSKAVRHISSVSFPATSIQSENQDNWERFEENILARLVSPATSESNYFSGSTYKLLPHPYGIISDFPDMISAPTSGTNSLYDLDMDPVEDVLHYFTSSE